MLYLEVACCRWAIVSTHTFHFFFLNAPQFYVSLITIPLRVIFLLFSPQLAPIRNIIWVVLFSPLFISVPFVIQLNFSCLVCFFFVAYDTHIIGFASIVYQFF